MFRGYTPLTGSDTPPPPPKGRSGTKEVGNIINAISKDKFEISLGDSNIVMYMKNNKICIEMKNVELSIKDNADIFVGGDLSIDTNGKLYLNCKMASQIQDLQDSIEYREESKRHLERMQELSKDLPEYRIPVEATHKEKERVLEKIQPKEILPMNLDINGRPYDFC